MSRLFTYVSVKCHILTIANKLSLLLLFIAIIFSIPSRSVSQTETPVVSREALFERAFKSLSFILKMSGRDKVFLENLLPQERQMFEQLYPIITEVTTLNWLEENGFTKSSNAKDDFYSYVRTKNRPANITTPKGTRVKLTFSSDQSLFKVSKDENIKDAATANDMKSDIFVNTRRINDPQNSYSLGDSFSIMIHEFGRKLEGSINQAAIDSLGAKIKNYVDTQISTTELSSGKVHVLKYRNAPFHEWMEPISFGLYKGVNIPFEFRPFEAFDMQGLFVLVENTHGIKDVTQYLMESEAAKQVVNYNADPNYKWAQMNWFLSSRVLVKESQSGRFRIELNINQLQFIVPFWQPGSPNPEQYQLYEKAFPMPPHNSTFYNLNWELDYTKPSPVITRRYRDTLKHDGPQYKAEFLRKTWFGEDLELKYKVSGQKNASYIEENLHVTFWPKLILDHNGRRIEVKATSQEEGSDIYKFRIPQLKKSNTGTIRVVGVELGLRDVDLSTMTPDQVIKGTITTIEEFQLDGPEVKAKTILKSVQAWDGKTWKNLNKKEVVEAQTLRFVFESNETLRNLSIFQEINRTLQYSTIMFPGLPGSQRVSGEKLLSQVYTWILFEEADMRQRLHHGMLYVDIEVDKNLKNRNKVQTPINVPDDAPEYAKRPSPFEIAQETLEIDAEGLRTLQSIKFVTQSLNSHEILLRRDLHFKQSSKVPPAVRCETFFKTKI